MSDERTNFVRIGAGSFATCFVWESHNNVVNKVVHNPNLTQDLRKEYDDLQLLYPIINSSDCLFKVPEPLYFTPSFAKWKEDMCQGISLQNVEPSLGSCAVYDMSRVWLVPPPLANSIRQMFFPEEFKNLVKPFVSRIYLGKEKRASSKFFNPLNFPLDVASLAALNINVSTHDIALQMGWCLALIHFKAKRDARDVEFVLGGKDLQNISFVCIDFNQMRPWNNHSELVDSFFINDLYYPRPGKKYWESFIEGYLRGAGEEVEAATKVLELLTQAQDEKNCSFSHLSLENSVKT